MEPLSDTDIKSEKQHLITLNLSILQAVESSDKEDVYRESVRDGERKRIYESPTSDHFFHIEYKLLPGKSSQIFKTDVVTFGNVIAKVYTDRDNRVVQCWSEEKESDGVNSLNLNYFGFTVNDNVMPVRESYLQEVGLGVSLRLSVTLTNTSGVCMPPSFLSFEPYMYSQQQKRILKDLSHMMLLSGNLVTSVPKLDPDKSHQHDITLVFLHKGNFQMEVKSYTLMVNSTTKSEKSSVQDNCSNTKSVCSMYTKLDSKVSTSSSEVSSTSKPNTNTSVAVENDTMSSTTHLEQEKNQDSSDTLSTSNPSPTVTPEKTSTEDSKQSSCRSPPLPLPKPSSPHRSSSSPTPPGGARPNKAQLLAQKYEKGIAARAALIYTEGNVSPGPSHLPKRNDNQSVGDSKSDSREEGVSFTNSRDVTEALELDNPPKASKNDDSKSLKSENTKTVLSLVEKKLLEKRISCCLPVTTLPEPVTVSPVLINDTSPIKNSSLVDSKTDNVKDHHISRTERTFKRETTNSRFQQLLAKRSQSAKSVKVISGPQFTFSISQLI